MSIPIVLPQYVNADVARVPGVADTVLTGFRRVLGGKGQRSLTAIKESNT